MEVQQTSGGRGAADGTNAGAPTPGRAAQLSGAPVGVALGAWQAAELRLARSFPECRGLPAEQLEDLYQDTALALLGRTFHSEEHLRNALRWGIKHRALHQHRDQRRRSEILGQHAPEIQLAAQQRQHGHSPEDAAVLDGDRVIVSEFLAELDQLERRIFWLTAEGLRYRSIAPILGLPVNQARKAARSCERKRERFQILYESGRLCGYRAQTITAIKTGEQVTEELAQRAYAHLQACAACRSQHNTNAHRLKAAFQANAAALAPLPLLAGRLPWITRLELRARTLAARLPAHSTPGAGVVRERVLATLATGAGAGKLAAGVATVAVIAGGTIGATHTLRHHHTHHPHTAPRPAASIARTAAGTGSAASATGQQQPVPHTQTARRTATSTRGAHEQQTGGFSYLGVPVHDTTSESAATQDASAASAGRPAHTEQPATGAAGQRGGGPFSP